MMDGERGVCESREKNQRCHSAAGVFGGLFSAVGALQESKRGVSAGGGAGVLSVSGLA